CKVVVPNRTARSRARWIGTPDRRSGWNRREEMDVSGRSAPALRTEILERVRQWIANVEDPDPPFRFTIGWAASYDQIFEEAFDVASSTDEIFEKSKIYPRIVLTGRGGGGKTVILMRVAREAVAIDVLPVMIDLANWTEADNKVWESCRASDEDVFFFM